MKRLVTLLLFVVLGIASYATSPSVSGTLSAVSERDTIWRVDTVSNGHLEQFIGDLMQGGWHVTVVNPVDGETSSIRSWRIGNSTQRGNANYGKCNAGTDLENGQYEAIFFNSKGERKTAILTIENGTLSTLTVDGDVKIQHQTK